MPAVSDRTVSWMAVPWVSFDTETTGVDVETDSILQIALVDIVGAAVNKTDWLLNWDIDIPAGAAKIHGLTRPKLAALGKDPATVLDDATESLAVALAAGAIVGMNLVFDLTMLDRNCRRVGVRPLSDRAEICPVIDVQVLDKHVDPYRKGKRQLTSLAEHYGVAHDGAHDAVEDALAAARVAYRIGRVFPQVGVMDPVLLHGVQQSAKQEQDASLRKHFAAKGQSTAGLDGWWPIRPEMQL